MAKREQDLTPAVEQHYVRNVLSGDVIDIMPGIVGRPGVTGIPPGLDIAMRMGADLIELEGGRSFPVHTHRGAHILYVLDGAGTVTIGGKTWPTGPGDLYFVPANVEHAVGAIERHRLISIGLPHFALDDPRRMTVMDGD